MQLLNVNLQQSAVCEGFAINEKVLITRYFLTLFYYYLPYSIKFNPKKTIYCQLTCSLTERCETFIINKTLCAIQCDLRIILFDINACAATEWEVKLTSEVAGVTWAFFVMWQCYAACEGFMGHGLMINRGETTIIN